MSDYTRQAISKGSHINLIEDGESLEHATEFIVGKCIGQGGSCYVYIAEYMSGDISHTCILKELYPKECGLCRPTDGIQLQFYPKSNEDEEKLEEYKRKYIDIEKRFLEGYRLQLEMHDGRQRFRGSKSYKYAAAVSAPRGLYRNSEGILYTVYDYSGGFSYDKYKSDGESLRDILNVIIQTGEFLDYVHRRGYLMLDVKEENILIVGGKGNQHVMMFDFGSMIRRETLMSYESAGNVALEFTSRNEEMIPRELRLIKKYYVENNDRIKEQVNKLGLSGERTDIALLAAILFRRIFGFAPGKNTINADWKFTDNDVSKMKVTFPGTKEILQRIFIKALEKDMSKRYAEVSQFPMKKFVENCKEAYVLAFLEESTSRKAMQSNGILCLSTGVTPGFLLASSQKHFDMLSSEGKKFNQLHKFSDRFNSRIALKDERESIVSPESAFLNSRKVLVQGDGGMGKSTMIYDHWKQQLQSFSGNRTKICFYIDLSRYAEIQKREQKNVINNGNSVEGVPREILSYIEVNILQLLTVSLAHNQEEVLRDSDLQNQMTALHEMLKLETEEPQFILFFDGYNEILNDSERRAFADRLDEAVKSWKNARFVVTSRPLVKNQKDQDSFKDFSHYTMIGISDEEITDALQEHRKMETVQIEILRKKPIWDILKIPMFLNMYLKINMEDAPTLNTRGEILHQYITQDEGRTADRISDSRLRNDTHSKYRKFLIELAVPFAASLMDRKRKFYIKSSEWMQEIENGWKAYFDNTEVKRTYTKENGYSKSEVEFDDERVDSLLLKETAYCSYSEYEYSFTHQYFRDYFAAKHIQNILNVAQTLGKVGKSKDVQLEFTKDHGLDYYWSDDVCILLGEMIGDYKNAPRYTEE